MKSFFMPTLERAFNAYLSLDAESAKRLQELKNKIVTLELIGIGIFQYRFTEGGLQGLSGEKMTPDVTIKGTPLSLLHLSVTRNRHRFFVDDVSIQGNLEL